VKLTPMRYKNYIWPHNPRVYEVNFSRRMVCHKVPFGAYVLQNMGRSCRVLRGEGEFVGEGAYNEFKKLASVFYENRPGLLVHPIWQESNAYFVKLNLREVPTEDYVAYSFEFWESFDQYGDITEAGREGYGEPSVNYYVLRPGESFWSAAAKYGGAERLLELNPQLRNPGRLPAGTRLRIR
jgi:hypothetical protein